MDAGAASRLRTLLETKQRSPTSNQTAKRLARLVALSRLTRDVVGGSFTLNTRIAFGHGCDCPNYVARFYSLRVPVRQLHSENIASLFGIVFFSRVASEGFWAFCRAEVKRQVNRRRFPRGLFYRVSPVNRVRTATATGFGEILPCSALGLRVMESHPV